MLIITALCHMLVIDKACRYYSAVMRRPTAMIVVPVQRTTSTESSTGPRMIVEFVHFSMLTDLCIYKHTRTLAFLVQLAELFI